MDMFRQSTIRFRMIYALAAFSVLYGLVVLWYVPTQPALPFNCLVSNDDQFARPGAEIRYVSDEDRWKGNIPEVGDHIIELGGRRIHSFVDFVRVQREWRNLSVGSEGTIEFGLDPSEEKYAGNLSVVEYPDKSRYVKCWLLRSGDERPLETWVPLIPQPISGISMVLFWFVLQMFVVVIGGVAYWNRPFDQPVRTFFALASVTTCAFLGGSHWWVVASSPFLISVFAIAGCFLPAVLLNFFVVYPFPVRFYRNRRGLSLVAMYGIPLVVSAALTSLIAATWFLTADWGSGPFAETLESVFRNVVRELMPFLRRAAQIGVLFAVTCFAGCVGLLVQSVRSTRNALEANQVRSILGAALFSLIPVAYTVYLWFFHPVEFALGWARLPMFLASVAFMFAYAVGIAKYKLLLVDQMVSRGVWYYSLSLALVLMFCALIAIGAVTALHQDLAIFGRTIPLVMVLMISVLVLTWTRDALQRNLDRHFFSEKYQFDKALKRMNSVVTGVLEPEQVSASLLDSCRDVLHVGEAALYLRKSERAVFRMLIASGRSNFPVQVVLEEEVFSALEMNRVWQKTPHARSPLQELIRRLGAEAIHGLEIQGALAGILVLGAKPAHKSYSAEDVAFVTAMARVASIALHCATVQKDVSRLNQDLKLKIEKISDQERQLSALQKELGAMSTSTTPVSETKTFHRAGIVGTGEAMSTLLDTVRKVAASDSSVLIRGESGTGKELLARSLHENSLRSSGPLVTVHCAALSPTLLESELFGHVKGAFTDAREDKQGRFQLADGGTLFLDEIGDISLDVQVKLLRVLQERAFEPVGGTKSVSVDVRVVAATHRDIEQLIEDGKFREDLFYRLNVISLEVPPLRHRKEDLYELARHFLKRAAEKASKQIVGFDDAVRKILERYDWPGNIRELQNVIERAVVLAEDRFVHAEDLPEELSQSAPRSRSIQMPKSVGSVAVPHSSVARRTTGDSESEASQLREALEQCEGNKAEAARMLGMPRSTFFSKLKKHKIV
ncbi:sigma 54-interacting transcriptional regulator [Thalassoglobus sp. JC818]|uniref:sigma 54-interacting transcriptional regulator n=1 Tax=Thalassoglobus sp. JC818 TaxID=3232136 RepID=UPI003459B868